MQAYINGFKAYLRLERSLSAHTVAAYLRDVQKFAQYLTERYPIVPLSAIDLMHCEEFAAWLCEMGIARTSQARTISGIKTFFRYLTIEDIIKRNPTELLETPQTLRYIPDVLTIEEIDRLLMAIDHSKPEGMRTRAIVETLYACGLRVSELVGLRLSCIYSDLGILRIIGKGNKERLVPIHNTALRQLMLYIEETRKHYPIQKEAEDMVFLNQRGSVLSRISVFTRIKSLATEACIAKKISPHTFRHSLATHLYEGGADLRVIQEILGHESITTTEIYTHVQSQYLRDTIELYHPLYKMPNETSSNAGGNV